MARIKIKGVKAYVSNGKPYACHRKTGTPLRSPFGTAEFLAELAAIEASMKARKVTPNPGSGARWWSSTRSTASRNSLDEHKPIITRYSIGFQL
jgi:hypothetical protein